MLIGPAVGVGLKPGVLLAWSVTLGTSEPDAEGLTEGWQATVSAPASAIKQNLRLNKAVSSMPPIIVCAGRAYNRARRRKLSG